MPKEAFGGDDEGSGAAPEKKKLGLGKFGLGPDMNIRDVFWRVMASYAATKKPGVGLPTLEHDRPALMRVAISVLSNPESDHYGLSPRFIATYSLMMMADGGWMDTLAEFLERAREKRPVMDEVAGAMRRLIPQEKYGKMLMELLSAMIRGRATGSTALGYIARLESPELVRSMKKELMIIARGDIGDDQLNAIRAISLIKEDEDVKKSLIILLSHWDSQARLHAAGVLESMAADGEVRAAAEKRLGAENDGDVLRILRKIAG